MRLAIMGAGSLGTIIGALITRNGGDPVLIDINKEHVAALNERGATITGVIDLTVPVKAITPDQMTSVYDVIIYAVKQYDNGSALEGLAPHIGPTSVVCTIQNGLPEVAVAGAVGRERTIGCAVAWTATWIEPAVSMLTSPIDTMGFDVGEMDGTMTKRLQSLAALLSLVCPTAMTPNLTGVRWAKLVANAAYSGVAAALGCTMGEVQTDPKALLCAAHVANEAINVSGSLGIGLETLGGKDLRGLAFSNKGELTEALLLHYAIWGRQDAHKPNMLQDLEKGKKCEIDAINGAVSAWGKKVGVPTPVNDKVVELVKGVEKGLRRPGFHHLEEIVLPSLQLLM